jgi:chitin synthase
MSIMGVLFLMALLEWALWLLSWWYCLAKAYQKAEDWSVKVLVFIMGAIFTLVRYVPVAEIQLLH